MAASTSDWLRAPDGSMLDLGLSRREQIAALLGGLLTLALLGEAKGAIPNARLGPRRWVDRQDEIARALAAGQISPIRWMGEVERLAAEVDLNELLHLVRDSRIIASRRPDTNDPPKRYVRFLDRSGTPKKLAYGAAFFDFSPTNVVTPHGHKHMVSAHLIVEGRFRVRNFDRLRDEMDAIVIRPTRDYVAHRGQISTMSSMKDNIHWFVPLGGPARTFDVIVSGLDTGAPPYEIKTIDPVRGKRLADGSIVAPIISFEESSKRYTVSV